MEKTMPLLTRQIKGYYNESGKLVVTSDTLYDRRKEAYDQVCKSN
jgi:hypothetical protein